MIQRKQTLFLFAAMILTIVCLCLPLGRFSDTATIGNGATLYNLWLVDENGGRDFSVWALFADLLITCPIAIMSIFSYKNRIVQSRFCMFNILLILGWYAIFAALALHISAAYKNFEISFASVLPALSLILYFMARKAILADEALVKAADRIR